jgi:hypothetical protein
MLLNKYELKKQIMEVTISGETFEFDKNSKAWTESGGYDLYIEEPGFDSKTGEFKHSFTNRSVHLPPHIESICRKTNLSPCSKVIIDKGGKKKLWIYFD